MTKESPVTRAGRATAEMEHVLAEAEEHPTCPLTWLDALTLAMGDGPPEAETLAPSAKTLSPTECGEDLAFLDDGKTLSRLPGEDVGVLCPGERGQYDALETRDDARQRASEAAKDDPSPAPATAMPTRPEPKTTRPGPVEPSEDELDDQYFQGKGNGVDLDELMDSEKPYELIEDEDIHMLSPEDQERYFDREEAYLDNFWRRQQEGRMQDLTEETYRVAYPEDAKRYFDE